MANATILNKIKEFSEQQKFMHNYEVLPDVWTIKRNHGEFSLHDSEEQFKKKSIAWQASGLKHGLVELVSRNNEKILDIACGEGMYSFIAGKNAQYVLGIDIDDTRIKKADFAKETAGVENVEFQKMNVYSGEFDGLESFDIAFCLGVLHRLPDPFNFINRVASKSNTVLFEWMAPPVLLDHDISWGYHAPGGLYEFMNATDNFESAESAGKSLYGGGFNRAAYWFMSYRAIEAICARAGLNHFVRLSQLPNYPDASSLLARRISLIASRFPCEFCGRKSYILDNQKNAWGGNKIFRPEKGNIPKLSENLPGIHKGTILGASESRGNGILKAVSENHKKCLEVYRRVASPFKYIYIDPKLITHHSHQSMKTRWHRDSLPQLCELALRFLVWNPFCQEKDSVTSANAHAGWSMMCALQTAARAVTPGEAVFQEATPGLAAIAVG